VPDVLHGLGRCFADHGTDDAEICMFPDGRERFARSANNPPDFTPDATDFTPTSYRASAVGEPSVDAGAIASAHGEFFAVDQHDSVLAIGFGAHFLHVLQVDDGGTMDAEEHLGVELLFEAGHGLAQQMGLGLGTDADVIFFGADPADVGDGEEDDSAARLEDDASGVVTSAGGAVASRLLIDEENLLAGALDGIGEALLGEGLQQIVHGVNFKGTQGVLIVRGCEDNMRFRHDVAVGTKLCGDIEAIHAGHLDIKKKQLWFGRTDQLDRLYGCGPFAHDVYFGLVPQELAQLLSSKHFIIGQNSMNHHTPYPVSCLVGLSENCRGSVSATRTLPCASSSIVKAWPFP